MNDNLIYANPRKINMIYASCRQLLDRYVYMEECIIKKRKFWFYKKETIVPAGFNYKSDIDNGYRTSFDDYLSKTTCQIENKKVYQKAYINIIMNGERHNQLKYYNSDEEMKKDLASLLTSISEAGGHPFVKIS